MELQIGVYTIPDGCTVKRTGNTINVYQKKKNKLDVDEYRCKDCKHYIEGHTGLHYWMSMVCDSKPKQLTEQMKIRMRTHKDFKFFKLYYTAQKYGKPCEMFELREEDEQ